MRFDIKTAQMNTTWQDMRSVWREADRIDFFDTAWNFDHFEPIFSDRSGPCLEAWSMLAAMAAETSRLKIGCLVTAMPYRHPSLLANMIATVDIISEGRLIVGLGAGWNADECAALGISLPPLRERFERFEEGLEVLGRLLRRDCSSYTGRYYSLDEAYCEPKPVQRPCPPVAIGGSGERRTLPLVARFAQLWNSTLKDRAEWVRRRDLLRRYCAEIGRDPDEITVSTNLRLMPGQDPRSLQEEALAWSEVGVDVCVVYLMPPLDPAVLSPLAAALSEISS